jgi:hypothetical protein
VGVYRVSFKTSAEGETTHVTRRDATSSILVLVMAKMPLPNGLGVLCKVDIVPQGRRPGVLEVLRVKVGMFSDS